MIYPESLHHLWGGWMIFWWIFLIAIVVGAAFLFARQGNMKIEKSALDILKER